MSNFHIKKVLHIIPHLGGGVGRVLLNYVLKENSNFRFNHTIVCLDCTNDQAVRIVRKNKWLSFNEDLTNYIKYKELKIINNQELALGWLDLHASL